MGRPPGIAAGTAQPFALALNLAQVPLAPGRRYEWRLEIDGETDDDWRVTLPDPRRASGTRRGHQLVSPTSGENEAANQVVGATRDRVRSPTRSPP